MALKATMLSPLGKDSSPQQYVLTCSGDTQCDPRKQE